MQNDQPLTAFITKLPEIIMAISVILAAYWSYKAKEQGKANSQAITDVHADINGKMAELLKTTGEAEFAKGEKAEFERPKGVAENPLHVVLVGEIEGSTDSEEE